MDLDDDLRRLYKEDDVFVDVVDSSETEADDEDADEGIDEQMLLDSRLETDEKDDQVRYLVNLLTQTSVRPLITDIPKMLSRHFNVDANDFPEYNEDLVEFVQELIDRSDSLLMFTYVNDLQFLTLSVGFDDKIYKLVRPMKTPDLLTAADEFLLTERLDLHRSIGGNAKSEETTQRLEKLNAARAKTKFMDDGCRQQCVPM